MALYLLISWRYIAIWFLPRLKFRTKVLNLLIHLVPPQCIPIFMVGLNFLLHILRYLYPKLVSIHPILGFHVCNYAVPLLQSMRHPPSEGGIRLNLRFYGVLLQLNGVILFDVLQGHPCCVTVVPFYA